MYEAPTVPHTPSPTINSMLNTYCSGPDEYLLKAIAKRGVNAIFSTINYVYDTTHDDPEHPSLAMWTVSCIIACAIVITIVYLLYAVAFFSGLFLNKVFLYMSVITSIIAVVVVFIAILFFEVGRVAQIDVRRCEVVAQRNRYVSTHCAGSIYSYRVITPYCSQWKHINIRDYKFKE